MYIGSSAVYSQGTDLMIIPDILPSTVGIGRFSQIVSAMVYFTPPRGGPSPPPPPYGWGAHTSLHTSKMCGRIYHRYMRRCVWREPHPPGVGDHRPLRGRGRGAEGP